MGPAAAPAAEDLATALADTNKTVVRSAVIAIGEIGPAARRALPALRSLETRATDAPQPLVRETIEFVEGRVGPVRSSEPTLQERCRNASSDRDVRCPPASEDLGVSFFLQSTALMSETPAPTPGFPLESGRM